MDQTNVDDFHETRLSIIREHVRASEASIEEGNFIDYKGLKGLEELAASIKAKGREALKKPSAG